MDYSWISNDTIRDLNRALQVVARDASAEYLDVYTAFMDRDGKVKPGLLSDDGVHLAAGGYELWAQVIEDYLSRK